uniref:THAP-type domain-containing protein n=1 Tax=Dicentrarchus labrax TaxID=13489 RepID=A0A8P4GU74_DICLA
MGRYKCAYNCETSSDSDVKFFKFPLFNPRKLKKWLVNMKWKDWTPSRFSVLCINHFEEQYIDRSGKCVKLREDAVPTIFSSADNTQKRKVCIDKDPKKSEKWRIIVDEGLMKIESFPHFFHGDYCVPQVNGITTNHCFDYFVISLFIGIVVRHKANQILLFHINNVKEPWQWLGLDVRGPLPQTLNGHKYVLTVTDYYSKWVEAVPMQSCLPSHVAKHIVDVIAHFGYPLRILSRLPHDIVHKVSINRELKDQLKVAVALVVYHQQTGTADLITQQLIDRMVSDLIEEHAADWDVYLPAKVFSLCFKEHSKTKERPFSVLCCKGLEPAQSPRGLNVSVAITHFNIDKILFYINSFESAVPDCLLLFYVYKM